MLKAVAQIVQRALQDAFSRAGLELPHREPEAHRSLGACPEEKQPEAAHEEVNPVAALIQIVVTTCDAPFTDKTPKHIRRNPKKAADTAKHALVQSNQDSQLVAKM